MFPPVRLLKVGEMARCLVHLIPRHRYRHTSPKAYLVSSLSDHIPSTSEEKFELRFWGLAWFGDHLNDGCRRGGLWLVS